MQFKIIAILLFSILTSAFAIAQQKPVVKDSTKIYSEIESFSKRGKFTKFMYSLIFKPVASSPPKKKIKKKVYKKLIQKPYSSFEGKIIRNINIETLDPFGYSIGDSIYRSPNFLSKAGNHLHIKSHGITIRNLLLIHQNQVFDSLLVKESERLVRSQRYVRDVSFFVKATAKGSDSVDIFIRELDIWSIVPKGSASPTSSTINLADKNFLGLGHEFQGDFTRKFDKGINSYHANYTIPNIRNSYVRGTVHFGKDGNKKFNRSFTIDRPFFSPFARWAAGVNFTQQFFNDSALTDPSHLEILRYRFNSQDYWAGNAIQLLKGNNEYKRTTNFISTVRFLRVRYLDKPKEIFDTKHMFTDENFYMASIGISTRKYVQDKYIFKFGITEDVPIGKVLSITGGIQEKSRTDRVYLGARISFGNYYPWGYLSSNFEYGTFIRAAKFEEGVFTAGANYFTGLFEIGKWKFRQFVKPEVTLGFNRLFSDSLTLNDGYGLDGFHSTALQGTGRLLLTVQTQAYAPWNFIGFRFGPFLICSLGMLSDEINGFRNSKVYSQMGVGVLIKNENLVFNTFQISLSFYPQIPGTGHNIFKMNSFSTGDFGFRDFEIGKPGPVAYR
ncbi:MAG TPA: hypothetical protein DCR40_02595 [Prolixibacteraceae bacterium]|nr:hypothetical protein [Prolixibacteraceae bacterium]